MLRGFGIHTLIYSQTYLQLASLQSLYLKKTKLKGESNGQDLPLIHPIIIAAFWENKCYFLLVEQFN